VLNPSKAFELVSRGVELLNLRLHALPSPAADVPHHRRVLLFNDLPSARVVDNEEAALVSFVDEMAIEEHIGLLTAALCYSKKPRSDIVLRIVKRHRKSD
jgi:hypothetical protein